MYNLSFDLAWKVMKDILKDYHGVLEYATGSPRENLRMAASVGMIEDDIWVKMLCVRNNLAHDYDGALAEKYFYDVDVGRREYGNRKEGKGTFIRRA